MRPVLTEIGPASAAIASSEAIRAVTSCDEPAVLALAEVPTTEVSTKADERLCAVLPVDGDPSDAPRLFVGAARVTAADVRAVRATFAQGAGYVVDFTLDSSGRTRFNKLAGELFPLAPPRNQVAIVVDGRVASAPAILEPSFPSGDVQFAKVGEGFTRAQARSVARSVRAAMRSG